VSHHYWHGGATTNLKRIAGLGPDNFRATLNSSSAKVLAASSEQPRRVVLLLDVSKSMIDIRSRWEMAILAGKDFVLSAPPNCSLSLVAFGAGIIREVGFGEERQKVTETLDDLARNVPDKNLLKSTGIYDALEHAVDLIPPSEPGDAIYAITDGDENNSTTRRAKLKDSLLQKQIRLFLFLISRLPSGLNNQALHLSKFPGDFAGEFGIPSSQPELLRESWQ
jgi:hypothetical protein